MSNRRSDPAAGRVVGSDAVPTMNDLFVDPRTLPTPPVAVLEIMRRADDPDVYMADIVALIESDVSIAVQVLRLANSALYAPASEITTITRAATLLGLRTIRLLALTTSLRALIPQRADTVDCTAIRQRMVVNAAMGRRVAEAIDPSVRDEAFTAGLLTGIGAVVLVVRAPAAAARLMQGGAAGSSHQREREVLGYTLDDVSVALIDEWGLPTVLGDSIRTRSEPLDVTDAPLEVCLKLGLLAERIVTRTEARDALPELRLGLSDRAGWSEQATDQWLIDAESVVVETADAIQFRLPRGESYSELLLEASDRLEVLQRTMEHDLFGAEAAGTLARRNDELAVEAATDPLTSLPNRRAFDERFSELVAIQAHGSIPEGRSLGLLLLDLDHFKVVNDTHGHNVGDDVLRLVGDMLRRQTRGNDFAARFGGEEFIMLIPDTSSDELFAVGERLRLAVADLELPTEDGTVVTITTSVGAALLDGEIDAETERALIELADRRLYEAKRNGRNLTWLA